MTDPGKAHGHGLSRLGPLSGLTPRAVVLREERVERVKLGCSRVFSL